MSAPRTVLPTLTEVVAVDPTRSSGTAGEDAADSRPESGRVMEPDTASALRARDRETVEQRCLDALQRELEHLLQARLDEAMAPAIDCAVDVLAARLRDQIDLLAEQLRSEMRKLVREAAARAAASVAETDRDEAA